MFSPTAGIAEDPATGSASAILAAQLLAADALEEGETRLPLHQGVEVGRPSVIGMSARVVTGRLDRVRIADSAVAIGKGRLGAPSAN
jgi:trans-2,3-dihydro-3-hydroxyanthranilate isomerase